MEFSDIVSELLQLEEFRKQQILPHIEFIMTEVM